MTQSANLGQIRVNRGGFSLDTQTGLGYNIAVALGAWCNGNTWVSKTFVEGSSPSAPATPERTRVAAPAFFMPQPPRLPLLQIV